MEHDFKVANDVNASNFSGSTGKSSEEDLFFITDVWHLCDRVLQRWMPHLTFDERTPDKTDLIQ